MVCGRIVVVNSSKLDILIIGNLFSLACRCLPPNRNSRGYGKQVNKFGLQICRFFFALNKVDITVKLKKCRIWRNDNFKDMV